MNRYDKQELSPSKYSKAIGKLLKSDLPTPHMVGMENGGKHYPCFTRHVFCEVLESYRVKDPRTQGRVLADWIRKDLVLCFASSYPYRDGLGKVRVGRSRVYFMKDGVRNEEELVNFLTSEWTKKNMERIIDHIWDKAHQTSQLRFEDLIERSQKEPRQERLNDMPHQDGSITPV